MKAKNHVTQAVIDTALQLVAGNDFNGKKRQTRNYINWLMNGTGRTCFAFNPDIFGIDGDVYPPCNDEQPWSPSQKLGMLIGKVWVDTIKAEIMDTIRSVVDISHCGAAYAHVLEDSNHVMRIGDSYFFLKYLNELQRALYLSGMEVAEVYENTKTGRITFVGYSGGQMAVLVLIQSLVGYDENNVEMPFAGRLTLMQLDAEAEIVPELIPSNIKNFQAFLLQEAQDARRFRKVYAVQLALYHTYYVLANNEREARKIAYDCADDDDFDDAYEINSTEESTLEEADFEGTLYDDEGEVDILEYKNELGLCDDDDN